MAVANGQLLAYFWLITLTAVLAMVLGGEILIQIGGPSFESAAPIIPLTAGAMSMPALYRSVSSMAVYPNKKRNFVLATILAAVLYVGFMLLLLTHTGLGIYTAPIAMMAAFLLPSTAMFLRSQLGDKPIDFPYLAMLWATLVAVVIAVGFHFIHPAGELDEAAGDRGPDAGLVRVAVRAADHPQGPLASDSPHRAVGAPEGLGAQVRPGRRAGLVEASERKALRAAVVDRLPPAALVPSTVDGDGAGNGGEAGDGAKATEKRGDPRPRLRRTPPKGRGWSGCCAAPASGAGSRSRSRASWTPASRCTCSPISRWRCA